MWRNEGLFYVNRVLLFLCQIQTLMRMERKRTRRDNKWQRSDYLKYSWQDLHRIKPSLGSLIILTSNKIGNQINGTQFSYVIWSTQKKTKLMYKWHTYAWKRQRDRENVRQTIQWQRQIYSKEFAYGIMEAQHSLWAKMKTLARYQCSPQPKR